MNSVTNTLFLVVLLCSSSVWRVFAHTDTTPATNNCTSSSENGQAIYCCSGACHDGGTIRETTGLCSGWGFICADLVVPPTCYYNQAFRTQPDVTVDAGIGECFASCQWAYSNWTWSCCDCPPNYISLRAKCDHYGPGEECFGCTEADETPLFNEQAQRYICDGPDYVQTACKLVNANTKLLGALGVGLNLFSAICPFSTTSASSEFQAISTLFGNVYSFASAASKPQNGIDGSSISAASALIGTVGSIAAGVGVRIAEVETGLPVYFAIICTVAAAFSLATSIATSLGNLDPNCTGSDSDSLTRRHYNLPMDLQVDTEIFPRAATQDQSNPCTELLGYLPGNYSVLTDIASQCNQLENYDLFDTLVAGVANTTNLLQQTCSQIRASPNVTVFQLPDFVTALREFEPYCSGPTSSDSLPETNNSITTGALIVSSNPTVSGNQPNILSIQSSSYVNQPTTVVPDTPPASVSV